MYPAIYSPTPEVLNTEPNVPPAPVIKIMIPADSIPCSIAAMVSFLSKFLVSVNIATRSPIPTAISGVPKKVITAPRVPETLNNAPKVFNKIKIIGMTIGANEINMVKGSLKQMDPDNWEEVGKEFVSINPSKRFGDVKEVASVVAFFLSEDAKFVNGTVLPIDGGQSPKY